MKDDSRSRADIEPILKEIVAVLVRDYQPEAIILYGSYAYGTPTRHSDVDLFIVKETERDDIKRYVDVARLIYGLHDGISVQPLVMTPKELRARQRLGDYFIEEILSKGKEIYRREARLRSHARRMVRTG